MIQRVRFQFARSKPLLLVLAGQGTQQRGMLQQLLQIGEAREEIQQLSDSLRCNFEEISTTDSSNLINKTKVTQPLLVLSQVLRFTYLSKLELLTQDYLIGHSVGEYSALCIAGSIGLEECMKLVAKRGELMETHTPEPSGMLIVRFSNK
jgi:[acyl-carrier-protein] S-malonyltransferase